MGQVFTWEEVRDNKIPRLGDFARVIKKLRSSVASEDSILGVLACGSTIRGDYNVRSDIDCFVLYDHERQSEAFAWMQEATREARLYRVPLVCIPCDIQLAGTRMHHVGKSFYRHMEKSAEAGGILKGNPLESIAESTPERDELESYLRMKMYNLQESWGLARTFSEERMVSYLKKMLEAPMHVARKTLTHREPLVQDSKVYVVSHYVDLMPRAMAGQLESLVELDAMYSRELFSHRRVFRKPEYERLLASILSRSEDVLSFVRANLTFIAEKAR
jgi:predicted nucleotidyltransferase